MQAAVFDLGGLTTAHQVSSERVNERTPAFKNPPIVEFVLGVQFSPLTKLSAGHFGLFWKELGEEWVSAEDGPPLPDQFELFDRPKWSQPSGIELRVAMGMPAGRFILHHRNQDRLIQIQRTRFHFNWRKTGELKPEYTHDQRIRSDVREIPEVRWLYRPGRTDAKSMGGHLRRFVSEKRVLGDASRLVQILARIIRKPFIVPDLSLEHRAAEWSFEIVPKAAGVSDISARPARWRDELKDSLLVDTTARGPIGKGGLREGLDLGHDMAGEDFLSITSTYVRQRWEEIV